MKKNIIMFEGEIETTGYFSRQLKLAFEKMGFRVFMFDYENVKSSLEGLFKFIEPDNTIAVSFNFHGISGYEIFLDEEGIYMWEDLKIPFYNIVVDHPVYYYGFLKMVPKTYIHISIDKNHEKFMEKFFPHINRGPFLPLAGTPIYEESQYKKIKDRDMEVVFTGNFAPYSVCEEAISMKGPDYEKFYRDIIDDMLANPKRCFEEVVTKHVTDEISDISKEDLRDVFGNMAFIDLYVRYYSREMVVKSLVDKGIRVNVFGNGWNKLKCNHPENLIDHGNLDSRGCLEVISNGKISLNIMPWFKEGAHDRIFNSMLNKAVCLTDSSYYLKDFLVNNENSLIFQVDRPDTIADIIDNALSNENNLQIIADKGYEMAKKEHTWEQRAISLAKLFF
ncbi:Glycosyl transferases group 1 [Acetitomaculum ruminis DSM 5522]|uniref:Glycosyl transferases group 1 n=1 Tax=Acetitomaculum ruminis DSM 5522 TaxID=1120918 RepID=A0A1I0YTE6_9FIRM|nr:glycosyltransferase [Acetitomaculum ruminis]SFB16257.1 Glycosyl transferases group 1 [Acetitomaculum ruminis DSM 5522]